MSNIELIPGKLYRVARDSFLYKNRTAGNAERYCLISGGEFVMVIALGSPDGTHFFQVIYKEFIGWLLDYDGKLFHEDGVEP